MSLLSNALYNQIADAGETQDKANRMATVSSINGGNVYIQFYGESSPSLKPFKRLGSYSPTVGDTVVLQNINGSYVITGKVV